MGSETVSGETEKILRSVWGQQVVDVGEAWELVQRELAVGVRVGAVHTITLDLVIKTNILSR